MKKRAAYYDGDRLDKNNRTSDHFLSVNSCGIHSYGPHSVIHTIREHGRVDYNFIYVEDGYLEATFNEESFVVTAGGFILYPPKMRQDYCQHGGSTYWVHFTGTAVEELLTRTGLINIRYFQEKKHEPRVTQILEKMLFHSVSKVRTTDTPLLAGLIELIAELERITQNETARNADDRLHPIIRQMNQSYKKEIDLDAYAQAAKMSRSRFCHLFKEITGCAPHAYIIDLRLKHARELLLSGDEPISQIAYHVGFTDPFYFSRLFKKKYGISPGKLRKK